MLPELDRRLIAHHDPRSPFSEAFRTLRTNIEFAGFDNPIRSLVITSTAPGEGKSTVAANLAIVVAMAGKSCILCDAELRRPKLHEFFGLSNHQGLTNLLMGKMEGDILKDVGVSGLRVLTSGPIPPNPSELLGSRAMGKVIEALSADADMVVFDTPPVTAVTDAALLGSRVDGAILVTRLGKLQRTALLRTKTLLENARVRIIGAVANDVRPNRENGYYYYYYYD